MSRKYSLFFLLFLTFCRPDPPEATSVADGEPYIQIQVIADKVERRVILQEPPLSQNNCGGNEAVSSTIERSRTIVYIAEIGVELALNASGNLGVPGVGQVQVGGAIANQYQLGYGQEETITRSITVSAAPGTNMVHTLEQVEYWETGEVVIIAGNETYRHPYKLRSSFGVELVGSENQAACPTATLPPTEVPINTVAPTSTPTLPPSETSTPRPTYTPRPSPTPILDTPPGTILAFGDTWYQGGMEARLSNINFASDCFNATVHFELSILNNSGQTLVMNMDHGDVRAFDNNNAEYDPNFCSGPNTVRYVEDSLKAGEEYKVTLSLRPKILASSNQLVFIIEKAGRITNARWAADVPR